MALGGCRSATDLCPAVVNPAIVVEIRDVRTATPLAQGARGGVRDGVYVDSLRPYSGISSDPSTLVSLQAALGRPGEYAVVVEHSDYLPWTVAGVKVARGQCGPRTITLHANLVAASK